MNNKIISNILLITGLIIIVIAVIWWATIFNEVVKGARENLFDMLKCLVSSSGECGYVAGFDHGCL